MEIVDSNSHENVYMFAENRNWSSSGSVRLTACPFFIKLMGGEGQRLYAPPPHKIYWQLDS